MAFSQKLSLGHDFQLERRFMLTHRPQADSFVIQSSRRYRAQRLARKLLQLSLVAGAFGLLVGTPNIATAQRPLQRSQPAGNPNATRPPQRVDQNANAARETVNLYTDAANFQNAGAYPLAIDAWKKFLTQFPRDPLASKVQHYLGVCYLQIEKPNYDAAIKAFKAALADPKLEVREEALVNLGWSLFYTSRDLDDAAKKKQLQEASALLEEFLEKYPDGSYADKAFYYLAESNYQLGNVPRAATLFRTLTTNPKLEKSSIIPDAYYSLGVAYEELKQPKLASEAYDRFLAKYSDHRLAREVQLRKAEYLLSINQADQAVELLGQLVGNKDAPMRDYILYRYGYALGKSGDYKKSAVVYKQLSTEFPNSEYATDSALAAGQSLMREQRYDDAKTFFKGLLPNKDDLAAQAAHWLAQIGILQGKPEDTISVSRDALGWAPESQWRTALRIDLADALAGTEDGKDEATTIYESVALEQEDHPSAARAAYNAAFAALRKGDATNATKWADYFAKRYKDDPLASEVAFVKAESLLQAGKHADAAAAFEQLIQAFPQSPSLAGWKLRNASAYFFGENYAKAIPALNKIVQESKDSEAIGEALFLLGASNFKQSKFDQAIESLKKSIAIEPAWKGVDEAYLILSEAYSKSGDDASARATLESLIAKFPNSPFKTQAEFRLGQLSADFRDFDEAIAAYDAVLAANDEPDLIEYARYGKSWVLIQQKRFDEALKLAMQVSINTKDESLRTESALAAAICLREIGKPSEAVNVLEKIQRESNISNVDSSLAAKLLLELGVAYLQSSQLDKASTTLQTLAKKYPDFPDVDKAIYENAWALKRNGQADKALVAFQDLIQRFPNSPLAAEAYYHVAQQDYDRQDFDSAVKAYTIAMTKTSDDYVREKSLYKLGWTHYQTSNWQSAARFFGDLSREYPDGELAIDAIFMQGECDMKLSRFREAVLHYKKAQQLFEKTEQGGQVDPQMAQLIYLHGAQAAREMKDWDSINRFTDDLLRQFPDSNYVALARFEKAFSLQNQKQLDEAYKVFEEIAESSRNEIGARSRFMMGEIHFSKREFALAVQEFQKVMYGYGATQAAPEIKNWQARSAIEAGRCSDLIIADLKGESKSRAIEVAKSFYGFVATNHSDHEMASAAQDRLAELNAMR